jgi:hypothetical protein
MGANRRKLVYQEGQLKDALNGEVLHTWEVEDVQFHPGDYRVVLETRKGPVEILEDEQAVWLASGDGDRQALTRGGKVHLPAFTGHPQAALLRALHAELLINVMPWGPVPNLWTYPRPWYRDAAVVALCLEETNNLDQLTPWIEGLFCPYDFNNHGVAEADNIGQFLYLASLAGGREHPVVELALKEVEKLRQGDHITGMSDHSPHPVYQTKWLKYGLRKLGLEDPYTIPEVWDSYSALFWMDFKEFHVPGPRFPKDYPLNCPYLNWAEAHFYGEPPPELIDVADFPLTREFSRSRNLGSSEASYARMSVVSDKLRHDRWSTPHTWHGAEVLLYLFDFPQY